MYSKAYDIGVGIGRYLPFKPFLELYLTYLITVDDLTNLIWSN
jgi:hypothetical protein